MNTDFTIYCLFIIITCYGEKGVLSSNCRQTLYNIDVPSIEHFRDLVNKFFNKTLKVIENTDPFSTSHIDLTYSSYGIESKGYLDELLLSGASSTKLSNIHIDDNPSLQFGIDVALKNIQFISAFSLNFNMLTMLPIVGDGEIGAAMSDLHFSVKSSFKELMDKRIQISDFQFDCRVGDVKVDISRLYNNTYLAAYTSHVVSDLIPLLLNELPPLKTYGGIGLMAALNSLLCSQAVTLQQVDISRLYNNTYLAAYTSHVVSDLIPLLLNELPPLKTYGGIGLMAALNSLLCSQAVTLQQVITFMEKFIQ